MKSIIFQVSLLFFVPYLSFSQPKLGNGVIDIVETLKLPPKHYVITVDSFKVRSKVPHPPRFKVNIDSLAKTLPYPQMELDNNIEGSIYGLFNVNSQGIVDSAWLDNKVSLGIDKTAVRFLKNLPKMFPARKGCKDVSTICQLVFHFRVKDRLK